MALRPVLVVPDSRLRQKALPVFGIDDGIMSLVDDMWDTMRAEEGCGLAANQIGVLKRIIVVDITHKDPHFKPLALINPEIIWKSETLGSEEEGCLSVPQQYSSIVRPQEVHVSYIDLKGNEQTIEAQGFLATCLQHEIDHLNGKLFIDYLSPLKKDLLIKKAQKTIRQ